MSNKSNLVISLALASLISSCSFVKLNPQAEVVSVADNPNSISNCKYIGKTNVSIWSSATTFQSDTKVVTQLDTLARNDAVNMGGNTVYPDTPVTDGTRTYAVYNCPISK